MTIVSGFCISTFFPFYPAQPVSLSAPFGAVSSRVTRLFLFLRGLILPGLFSALLWFYTKTDRQHHQGDTGHTFEGDPQPLRTASLRAAARRPATTPQQQKESAGKIENLILFGNREDEGSARWQTTGWHIKILHGYISSPSRADTPDFPLFLLYPALSENYNTAMKTRRGKCKEGPGTPALLSYIPISNLIRRECHIHHALCRMMLHSSMVL